MAAMRARSGNARPRLSALPAARRLSPGSGASNEPDWFNAPVPSFGPIDARLLIVGLAPGLRGANRTGRPFTGDYAGDLLYATLKEFGFARGQLRGPPRRRAHPGRLPHHQCGALRAAGEQADAAGDHHLPRFSRRHDRGNAASFAPSSRWAASRTKPSLPRGTSKRARLSVQPWRRAPDGRDHFVR